MALHIPRINYQHLLYFWAVVRTGSLRLACEELNLSAPTVSAQLRRFEERLGEKLLTKSGRTLVPTEVGRLVFTYADEIFALGSDMLNALAQRPTERPMRLAVGIDDVVPKEIVRRLLDGAVAPNQPVQLICREGTFPQLLASLQVHDLDVVISDAPATPSQNKRLYNHMLGACGEVWMAAPSLAKRLRGQFPKSLDGAPVLMPTDDTAIRASLDQWLERHSVRPFIVGEFEDYALLREFARHGRGIAPVPEVLAEHFRRESGLVVLGPARKVRTEFYAISTERKLKHPAVIAIAEKAGALFGT
jgi:LysR family transcriptional activator of nhaA